MEPNGRRNSGLENITMAFVAIYSLFALIHVFNQAAADAHTTPWKLLKKTLLYMIFGGIVGTVIGACLIAIQCHAFHLSPGIILLIVAFCGWRWYNSRTVKKQIRQQQI